MVGNRRSVGGVASRYGGPSGSYGDSEIGLRGGKVAHCAGAQANKACCAAESKAICAPTREPVTRRARPLVFGSELWRRNNDRLIGCGFQIGQIDSLQIEEAIRPGIKIKDLSESCVDCD